MALISKSDLVYTDYSWTVYRDDNPKITGNPDNTLLNRKEGYEVLYFINKFADIYSLKNKSSANKIEKMIREDVPTSIRSQDKIKDWIKNNW
ncbi:hypothetical protein [Marinifilum sp. D714]|uniref:hypothetical protein n=1 Tax=Marinifilum sp. D714 TaxID=2937523 RepID=UPI0027BDFB7D|nr:hypothetical protein [Marinifilum sp. D714]MDQ2178856.1 hypothetical protein [Marinifilum sp. D714]